MIVVAIRVKDFENKEPNVPSEKRSCADCSETVYVSHGTLRAMDTLGDALGPVVCMQCAVKLLGLQELLRLVDN